MAHEQHIVELRDQYMPDGYFDESKYGFTNITTETFTALLSQYSRLVPAKLKELETQRLETIPAALQQRGKDPSLTKSELATLMDWKLSHGKFRPALKSLIQQNSPESVGAATRQAFSTAALTDQSKLKASITTLTALKGVGPATASLLLSVHDPTNVVFFADEVFRWACYDDSGAGGWSRPVKYSLAEYSLLAERVQDLRRRLGGGLQSLDVEMVGYVLGKLGGGQNGKAKKKGVDDPEGRKRKGSEKVDECVVAKRGKPATSVQGAEEGLTNRRSLRNRK
nr:uncharacterized protein LOC112019684 [Quercus suber]POF16547.1 hypothetical protein CFP56_24065 [Quercus suber]